MSVKTAFMFKHLEAMLPGELDGTTDRHTDIATYRLNRQGAASVKIYHLNVMLKGRVDIYKCTLLYFFVLKRL